MSIDENTAKYKDAMVMDPPFRLETGHPEKIIDDPEHKTCVPENKDPPRAITGWKVRIPFEGLS